jgi:hypothetical protein
MAGGEFRSLRRVTPFSAADVHERLLSIFEQTRQARGAPFEPQRLLAFLTEPPAPKGRRVADTFAGRRRFMRFMNAVQLETGICFTQEEWDGKFGLDDLTELVTAKAARPDRALHLAKQRLQEARRRRLADPVKFGLLLLPLLVGAALADAPPLRIALALAWIAIVGAVAAFSIWEIRYSMELVSRIAARASGDSILR